MMTLWFAALLLALLAVLFIIYPLLTRQGQSQSVRVDDPNIALFREHLADLEQQRQRDDISHQQFDELKRELERTLLSEAKGDTNSVPQKVPSPKAGLIWLLIVITPLVAFVLYRELGASQDLTIIDQLASVSELRSQDDHAAANQARKQLVDNIDQRLQRDPENFYYWVIKARLASDQQQYAEALAAYRTALPLSPQDVTLLEEYLQVAFIVSGGKPTEEIGALVERILTLSPDNLPVLGLSGRLAFEAGDYGKAIAAWQRVLAMLPEGHQTAGLIEQELASAQRALAELGGQVVAIEPARIDIEVSVAEELAFNRNDTLFVIARRVGQSGPPLAVKRFVAAAFPMRVTLTDQDLMLPGGSLDSVDQLEVIARLSRSGEPLPQAGDRQGKQAVVSVSDGLVTKIEIDRLVE